MRRVVRIVERAAGLGPWLGVPIGSQGQRRGSASSDRDGNCEHGRSSAAVPTSGAPLASTCVEGPSGPGDGSGTASGREGCLAARGHFAGGQSRGSPSLKARLKMILTQCPVCAAELPPLSAKQCSRCKTRYCGPACQKQHWEAGGHDKLCRKIRKGGGAEQYHADTKYTEIVAVAVEACAEDTKGQTCYICTQALHWKTKEGLIRMCACRGTAGFAHVSCLAEQAKILVAEAEENNLEHKVRNERFHRWDTCSLCEQEYHGIVKCALGWACWKTYVGRPEADQIRCNGMNVLGNGLYAAKQNEDALSVRETELAILRRLGVSERCILVAQSNLASTYQSLGRHEEAMPIQRDVYSGRLKLNGEEQAETLRAALNYAISLKDLDRFEEARSLLRKTMPVARRVLGESSEITLTMRFCCARTLCMDTGATLEDLREAATMLEETERTARRVLGGAHPLVVLIGKSLQNLQNLRAVLQARRTRERTGEWDSKALVDAIRHLRKTTQQRSPRLRHPGRRRRRRRLRPPRRRRGRRH